MSNDPLDLPVRRTSTYPTAHDAGTSPSRSRLSEQQVDVLVHSGAKVAEGVVAVAKELVAIAHIRAASDAEVSRIRAHSEAVVNMLRSETECMMENRKGIRTKGEAAALVIEQVLKTIPEADTEARKLALSILPQLVREVVAPSGKHTDL